MLMSEPLERDEKAQLWLRRLCDRLGRQADTGIPQAQVSKILSGERPFTAKQADRVAAAQGMTVAEVFAEIEQIDLDSDRDFEPAASLASINRRFEGVIADLFEHHPHRARRLALNLQYQEELGLTDLISQVVAMILDKGPNDAALPVAHLLGSHHEVSTVRSRRAQNRFRAAFRQIEDAEAAQAK